MIDIEVIPILQSIFAGNDIAPNLKRTMIRDIARNINDMAQRTFQEQEGLDGKSWKQDDISERWKKTKGHDKIMFHRGYLSDTYWFFRPVTDGFEFGSSAEHAVFHNLPDGSRKFPARYFAAATPKVISEIEEHAKYLFEKKT